MVAAILLVISTFVIIFTLEILNAFYDAMFAGLMKASPKERRVGLLKFVLYNLRNLLLFVFVMARTSALYVHEFAHAVGQFLGGAMPRIVICKGGGYASARPWPIPGGNILAYVGQAFWLGIACMAPLLLGGGLVLAAVYFLTPLRDGTELHQLVDAIALSADAKSLGGLVKALLGGIKLFVGSIFAGGAVGIGLVFLISLAVASGITPSSVDFIHGRYHLVGYGVATILAATLLERLGAAKFVLLGIGAVFVVIGFFTTKKDRSWHNLFLSMGSTSLIYGVVAFTPWFKFDPSGTVVHANAGLLVLLLMVVTTFVFFVVFMALLGTLGLTLSHLFEGAKAVPAALKSVFTDIAICTENDIMFQDMCDYCGCALGEFKEGGCQGKNLERARPMTFKDVVQRVKDAKGQ